MFEWLFNSPVPITGQHLAHFFSKFFDPAIWLDFFLAQFGFLLVIVLPGLGLSYILQPKILPRALRLSFGLALGFLFPVFLFYLLGFTHLYMRGLWAAAGVLLGAIPLVIYRERFLKEWTSEPPNWKSILFYGSIAAYFLLSYISLHFYGTLDADILFGQTGPASHLFKTHVYQPFDMGVLPIHRHELFPGPIAFHSAFSVFGAPPWVAVTAVMVFLAPLMLRMVGQLSEGLMKKTEFLSALFAITTFAGFRLRGGRGTVLALTFLFGFLLLPQIFTELGEKGKISFKKLWRPILSGSIFVGLSLYTNIEIAAILLGVMAVIGVMTLFSGQQAWYRTICMSAAGGLIFFTPWFITVSLLVFKEQLLLMSLLYAALIAVAVALAFIPSLKWNEKKVEYGFLGLLMALFLFVTYQGQFESVFRLSGFLMPAAAISAALFYLLAFKSPNLHKHGWFISVWIFALSFIALMPYFHPIASALGVPDSLNYFLFEKELGSVFPETRAKIHEYFLPFFGVMLVSMTCAFFAKYWPWKTWIYQILVVVFCFVTVFRLHETDFLSYPKGQTVGANIDLLLASSLAFEETPPWLPESLQEVLTVLDEEAEVNDDVFNMYAVFNPYSPEFLAHYIVYGISTTPLEENELVTSEYTTELLDQVIAAGTDFILIVVDHHPVDVWLNDARIEILASSQDTAYVLLKVREEFVQI